MTLPQCKHWSPCAVRRGGCCAIGLHRGRPSLGICGICVKKEPPAPGQYVSLNLTVPADYVPERDKYADRCCS